MHSDKLSDTSHRALEYAQCAQTAGPLTCRAPAPTAVLTRPECAEWLGISARQLARLRVPCFKLGHFVRYSVAAVLQWMQEEAMP